MMARRRRKRGLGYGQERSVFTVDKDWRASGAKRSAKARKLCPNFAALVADARQNHRPREALMPLFKHMIRLATDAAANGDCTRAGREIGQAKKLWRRHGKLHSDDD